MAWQGMAWNPSRNVMSYTLYPSIFISFSVYFLGALGKYGALLKRGVHNGDDYIPTDWGGKSLFTSTTRQRQCVYTYITGRTIQDTPKTEGFASTTHYYLHFSSRSGSPNSRLLINHPSKMKKVLRERAIHHMRSCSICNVRHIWLYMFS